MAMLKKTALAWATSEASPIGLNTNHSRPFNSSGASALVNDILKPSAAIPNASAAAVESCREAQDRADLDSRWTTSR